ncbi:sugar transferase [Stutzerimonas balearica]|uniref:sugar transferase n=1 Tax=Stutzerimonas balearica TaxID=74829 RepID=UPI0028A1BF2F|nr:sugar transferase [Stutzerimonas balearica]
MIKRVFDIAVSSIGLLVLAPVMALLIVLVKRNLGSPVFFRQIRPGLNEKPFQMIKFRTMREAYDCDGKLLPDSERLTKFGNFLRSSSLDELPELWNVLIGDMSLVGPRPLLTRYLDYYTDIELVRYQVRPGITGWAQVNGRNESSWDARLAHDVWYVENRSFALDLKILVMTLFRVVKSDGVVVDPSAQMLDLDEERKQVKTL